MKILQSERLYLRTLEDYDAMHLSYYRSKQEVKEFQSWDSFTIEDAKKRIKECKNIKKLNLVYSNYHLAIVSLNNDKLIGDLFVQVISKDEFTLGYTLDSNYWNQGYAYEIINEFLKYMKSLSFNKVICYVYNDNVRSIRLLKKLGFSLCEISYYYDDRKYEKNL